MIATQVRGLLCLAIALWCLGCSRPTGGLLRVGAAAPEVVGIAADGRRVALSALRGQPVVVYFYPKDGTPGCTKEACGFRDAFARYQQRRVEIFGVSQDSAESHEEFRREYQLPFVLVADPEGTIAQAYGVGSIFGLNARVTFLIGPDGKVARVWPDVTPASHPTDVLAAIDSLRSSTAEAGP
jgi:peroxiredoxin Q/BCP